MSISYPYKFSDWYGYDKDCANLVPFPATATNYSKAAFACGQASNSNTVYLTDSSPTVNQTIAYSNATGTTFQGQGHWGVDVLNGNANFKMTVGFNGVITAWVLC